MIVLFNGPVLWREGYSMLGGDFVFTIPVRTFWSRLAFDSLFVQSVVRFHVGTRESSIIVALTHGCRHLTTHSATVTHPVDTFGTFRTFDLHFRQHWHNLKGPHENVCQQNLSIIYALRRIDAIQMVVGCNFNGQWGVYPCIGVCSNQKPHQTRLCSCRRCRQRSCLHLCLPFLHPWAAGP